MEAGERIRKDPAVRRLSMGRRLNRRQKTLLAIAILAALLLALVLTDRLIGDSAIRTELGLRNLPPSLRYPFGTDWLGRNVFLRTVKGLALSLWIGFLASTVSVAIALALGLAAGLYGRLADGAVSWLVDLFLSMPHLVMIILTAFILGGGAKGVILAVAVTHWPSLARLVRAEVMQVRNADYVEFARKAGKSGWWIAKKHILPHLVPQVMVGYILLFPHAILHEASITFLGFGLTPHRPAIGVMLSEAMRYLSTGQYWLALFPGLSLLVLVRVFYGLGGNLRLLIDPWSAHE